MGDAWGWWDGAAQGHEVQAERGPHPGVGVCHLESFPTHPAEGELSYMEALEPDSIGRYRLCRRPVASGKLFLFSLP